MSSVKGDLVEDVVKLLEPFRGKIPDSKLLEVATEVALIVTRTQVQTLQMAEAYVLQAINTSRSTFPIELKEEQKLSMQRGEHIRNIKQAITYVRNRIGAEKKNKPTKEKSA
jgi:hypothetical protein